MPDFGSTTPSLDLTNDATSDVILCTGTTVTYRLTVPGTQQTAGSLESKSYKAGDGLVLYVRDPSKHRFKVTTSITGSTALPPPEALSSGGRAIVVIRKLVTGTYDFQFQSDDPEVARLQLDVVAEFANGGYCLDAEEVTRNDSQAAAQEIVSDSSTALVLCPIASTRFGNDEDWYVIKSLPSSGRLTVEVKTTFGEAPGVELYDGTTLVTSNLSELLTKNLELNIGSLTAGTHQVHMRVLKRRHHHQTEALIKPIVIP